MKNELQDLLQQWRDRSIDPEGVRRLADLLDTAEARAALRNEWFLEAALPQALVAGDVRTRMPAPSRMVRIRERLAEFLTAVVPRAENEDAVLPALRLWARASFSALALAVLAAGWLTWPNRQEVTVDVETTQLAQLMLQAQLPDTP